MLKASGAMAAATLTSRVLGMVREMVYARFMGDTPVAGIFKFAFQIPNLFRRLLGEGALTAAFIPIFKEKEKNHGEAEMWRASNAVISGLIIAASAVVGLVILALSLVLAAHQFSAKTELMLQLLRVMFPYMILVCLAAVTMGMLNARGHFFIPAMGATMLNVVMIASVLLLAPHFGHELSEQIFALAFGVLAAGVAQLAFQMPSLWHEGFHYHWVSPWKNETVRIVVVRMIPGTIGVAAFQINVAVVQLLSFWVDPAINASFDYAVRLMELPQGMFGISLATYLLTALSALAVEKNYAEFRTTLRQGIGSLLFANLIAAVLLVVLAEPIVRLLFENGGKFTAASTMRAAFALECLAPGLVAFSTVNVLARAFYRAGRHPYADENQPGLSRGEPDTGGPAGRAAPAGRTGHCQYRDLDLQRRPAAVRLAEENGPAGNGGAAQLAAAARTRRPARRHSGLGRLAPVGKPAGPPNHRLENRRGVCAGGNRRSHLLAGRARVQNPGGTGDDGVLFTAVQETGATRRQGLSRIHAEGQASRLSLTLNFVLEMGGRTSPHPT
jgi:putative peptidoglycan lipid II flippase